MENDSIIPVYCEKNEELDAMAKALKDRLLNLLSNPLVPAEIKAEINRWKIIDRNYE